MRFLKPFFVLICITLQFNCISQNASDLKNKDLQLLEIYKKFYDNRHDYAGKKGEARDTILNRFKNTLIKTLKDESFLAFPFDSLSTRVKIVTSKDKKLRVFSWNELNGGTWHIYNSAFQYKTKQGLYSGLLSFNEKQEKIGEHGTDITHYEINNIDDGKYLIKGYGTHGSGKEFFVYRLLSFKSGNLIDCSGCFDGKDRFVYEVTRGDDLEPAFNKDKKEITYYELKESYVQGDKNAPSGFMDSTGKILKLKYKNGLFTNTK